jgi:uncharacterized DUF497 family protein
MNNIEFSWDDKKAEANWRKHGIKFETAVQVFADPFHLTRHDRIEGGEYRWQTVGMVEGAKLLLVAHGWSDRDGIEHIRLISARPATRHERRQYEDGDS